jgi:hypothetical protein
VAYYKYHHCVTLQEKLWCAVPWFLCKTINLSIQFIGLIYYNLMNDKPENRVLATALFNFGNVLLRNTPYGMKQYIALA